jgi:hypothetical protein
MVYVRAREIVGQKNWDDERFRRVVPHGSLISLVKKIGGRSFSFEERCA